MYEFIADLDAYFCKRYTDYDKICVLKGYKMPLMQVSGFKNGRAYAYTLPANTMRLELQENKAELLQQLKEKMSDTTISFSFHTIGFFARCKRAKQLRAAHALLTALLKKYQLDSGVPEGIDVEDAVWGHICTGKFIPSKNLIFSLALVGHFSMEDTKALLDAYEQEFDYTKEKDVVISYLLEQKVFNREMVEAALTEYKVRHLLLK